MSRSAGAWVAVSDGTSPSLRASRRRSRTGYTSCSATTGREWPAGVCTCVGGSSASNARSRAGRSVGGRRCAES